MRDGLNSQQREAVETTEGRVLILAGAGSGKTRVLTIRMAYLITEKGVPPEQIVGLTFTNKAAAEMRHRLGQLVPPKIAKRVTLSTFHSFCLQILRAEIHHLGFTPHFTLYDEKDMHRMASLIARDELQHEGDLPSLEPALSAIAAARHRGAQAESITGTGSDWHDTFTQTLYKRLQASMRAYNALDFDGLLGLTVELFEKHPAVLKRYHERFRYLMIDEYQDTNPIQYRLAEMLTAASGNLCVVGDDDQSIYGWRGADIRNILSFEDAKLIKLEQNYRSQNTILKAANSVIAHNKSRHSKALWSQKGEGEPIEVFHAPSELDEAMAVSLRIAKLREKGVPFQEMAIIYRSNQLSRHFEVALLKQRWWDGHHFQMGIPFQVYGGTEFYERKEVKDLLAYLRLIQNPHDQEALLRIINQPRRGIGEQTLDLLTAFNRNVKIPLWEVLHGVVSAQPRFQEIRQQVADKALTHLEAFVDLMEEAHLRFQIPPLHSTLQWLVDRMDYTRAIREEVKSEAMRAFKHESVQEFITSLSEFETRSEHPSLADFTAGMTLDREYNGQKEVGNKVNLMTIHSSKGLEFPYCFLVGMEDHILPHEKSVQEGNLEEERRLLYVAITRAMQKLTLSMSRTRKKMGKNLSCTPSRFLFEIPPHLLKSVDWGNP